MKAARRAGKAPAGFQSPTRGEKNNMRGRPASRNGTRKFKGQPHDGSRREVPFQHRG